MRRRRKRNRCRRRSSSSPPPHRRPKPCSRAMADAGFNVTHLYGLTETYGPAVVNDWKTDWDELDGAGARRQEGAPGGALSRAGRPDRDGPRDDGARARRWRDDGRGDVPRQHRDEGLSQERQGDRRSLPGRLVPFRRPRRDASRWLHPAQGPLEGHHHLGRREHFIDRGGGRALQASRRFRRPPWWRGPTTNGARRPAPSWN